jgi:hypothetical protein
MTFAPVISSLKAGKDRILSRIVKDLQSHRSVWNYVYMALYVFLCIYLVITHGAECGNTIIMTTGGVVTGIFTNTVWSKTIEKIKENPNVPTANLPKANPNEIGASD